LISLSPSKFLRKAVNSYYQLLGNLDVVQIANDRLIQIDWILEAGCHDGSDSVELSNSFHPIRYLAFEPDKTARLKAAMTIEANQIENIELYPFGLSNVDKIVFLKYEAEGKGSGSTHFSDEGEDSVKICTFDNHFEIIEKNGLLWLDVEGHALQALEGMRKSLKSIAIARVEVQLHTRNKDFVRDFKRIIRLMKSASLVPIYGPVHPSHFGDIIFARSSQLSFRDKVRGRFLLLNIHFFHSLLFPLLRKPS
jgi:FkbM family methyltransferase